MDCHSELGSESLKGVLIRHPIKMIGYETLK
jgi:hypothetical protein